jgi:hypothetical protein
MDIDKPPSRERDPLLRWFATAHLQPNLRPLVEAYVVLAHQIVNSCDPSPERTLALRDLIASKDNAVRALIETPLKGTEVQV